jgi:hypothetical protein
MAVIPPWISVNPKDFVDAAAGGARIGAELAGQASERGIAGARNATALQEAQMRANTEEAAQAQAAQNAAAQREMEKQIQQFQIQQQIKQQQNAITGENFRNQNTIEAENARAAATLAERKQYGVSMLDIRREQNRIAQERADAAALKPSPQDLVTTSEYTPGVAPHEEYTITDPGKPANFFGFGSRSPSSLSTTNANDLLGLNPGSTISTNKIPGSPSITTTRRVPSLPPPSQPRRIVVKNAKGEKFTIPSDQLDDAKKQGYSEVK